MAHDPSAQKRGNEERKKAERCHQSPQVRLDELEGLTSEGLIRVGRKPSSESLSSRHDIISDDPPSSWTAKNECVTQWLKRGQLRLRTPARANARFFFVDATDGGRVKAACYMMAGGQRLSARHMTSV